MTCHKCGQQNPATATSREVKKVLDEYRRFDVVKCLTCFHVLKITEVQ